MAQQIADQRDIEFVLYEQLRADELTAHEKYKEFNRKTFDLIISEARKLAIKELLPTYAIGDQEGVRFENGEVKVPESFHRPFKLLVEAEMIAKAEDPDYGGQGLPNIIARAVDDYLEGGNWSLAACYALFGLGTGKMIELHGTEEQKKLFVEKLYTGLWAGTMLLTEPNAGTDLGELTTTARKNPDGTYSLSGNKIFITAGDHDLTENIIHPVLARIEGAPAGTKGISLFIVPKIWVNEDGSLGEPNDIVCTGIEEKMGIHGSATCSMALGGKGNCRGFLLGEENKGMKIMFLMMNGARLAVGAQGYIYASTAYLHALNYAKERLQGKDLSEMLNPDAPQVRIIQHPDVRRMLISMKAYVEGMRSFIYYVALCFDKMLCAETKEEKERFHNMMELLTPVVKAYCTDRGFDVCVEAVQVYGGYGYTKEYPVEQLVRDCKITSIFEGTNGVQAMDLLGRKLGLNKGSVFIEFLMEIQNAISKARHFKRLDKLADNVEEVTNRLGQIAMDIGKMAMSQDFKVAFSFSQPFLEVMGDLIMSWMLLWRATVSAEKLEQLVGEIDEETIRENNGKNKQVAFYDGQFKSAEYFILTVLPITLGKMNSIKGANSAVVEIAEASFGG
jgi:alkylation response protein AidB-like acyl-CoA dehydrogenase